MSEPSKDTLRALAARLAEATGPDRELDLAIWMELVLPRRPECHVIDGKLWIDVRHPFSRPPPADHVRDLRPYGPNPEEFTASIDAALALVGATLPGWGWHIEKTCAGLCRAVLWYPTALMHDWRAAGTTPALALLSALIAALEARDEDV